MGEKSKNKAPFPVRDGKGRFVWRKESVQDVLILPKSANALPGGVDNSNNHRKNRTNTP